jgi:hypothetical protein
MLKKTFGGGPEIQFFLTNNEQYIRECNLSLEKNFIYHQPYMYGYPDKHPEYYNFELELRDLVDGKIVPFSVSYKLLISRTMTAKTLLYHISSKLEIDIVKLSLVIASDGADSTEMGYENDEILISEIGSFFINPKLSIQYMGTTGKLMIPLFCQKFVEYF